MSGQIGWAGDGLREAWYNPADWYRGARDSVKRGMVSAGGGYSPAEMTQARAAGVKMGARSGREGAEKAFRDEGFGKSLERTAQKGFSAAGKKIGAAGEYASEKAGAMSKGLRQGMDDNPAGMAAAAGGALLGGWALSKLRRKRQQAPG